MMGGDVWQGAKSGAWEGAIGGGISYGIQHASLAIEADNLELTGESAGEATNDNLQSKAKTWFGKEEGKDGLNSLEVAKGDNLDGPGGYYIDQNGNLRDDFFGKQTKLGGYTQCLEESWYDWSDVRISAHSFNSNRRLYMFLGHEFVHVDQFYYGSAVRWKNIYGHEKASNIMEMQAYWGNAQLAKIQGWDNWYNWNVKTMGNFNK